MRKIYTSIDIGSDSVKFLVAEAAGDKVNILARTSVKAKGIRKGFCKKNPRKRKYSKRY